MNVLLFIAYNNMEALDIPQESLLAMVIRYGLYVGAVFQMICLGAVIFMVPRNSSKSLTAGAIWSFLKVRVLFWLLFFLNFHHLFSASLHEVVFWRISDFVVCYFRVILKNIAQAIHRRKKHRSDHTIAAENRIKRKDVRFSVKSHSIFYCYSILSVNSCHLLPYSSSLHIFKAFTMFII